MAGNLISIIFHTFFAKLKISWEYQIQHLNSSFNIFNMMKLFIFAKDRWLNQKKCWSFWKSQTCFQELFFVELFTSHFKCKWIYLATIELQLFFSWKRSRHEKKMPKEPLEIFGCWWRKIYKQPNFFLNL